MTIAMQPPHFLQNEYKKGGLWNDEDILDAVLSAQRLEPERAAVVDEEGGYTFGDVVDLAARLAGWLHSAGVEPGDVVSVQLPNWREAYVAHLAIAWAGAVANTLLPQYHSRELRHVLTACGTRVLITPFRHRSRDDFIEVARELLDEVESLGSVLVVRPEAPMPAGFTSFETALQSEPLLEPIRRDADLPAVVVFTSGTESLPKGVVHSRNSIAFGMRSLATTFGLKSGDAVWAPSPIGHGTGYIWGLRLAMALGSTVLLQDRWDAKVAVKLLAEHRAVYTTAATPFVQDLLDHVVASADVPDLSSFSVFCCGGTTIPRELVERTKRVLGAELLACWGMTECFIGSVVSPDDDIETKTDSDGRALPGVELRIVTANGEGAAPLEEGELQVRGPNVMLGYLPTEGVPKFVPGDWFATGDLATIDADGRLRIVGRKKDIIIRGGLNISPAEIEAALIDHPQVQRVSIVGYADARLGERACAFVVPFGEPPSLADLTGYLRAQGIATYKLPERIEVVPDLPVTAAGKVKKAELRQRVQPQRPHK